MKQTTVRSVCECQALLYADLDENGIVLRGSAKQHARAPELSAPANTVVTGKQRFDVGWFCPFCIRNTLRSFDAGGLAYREVPAERAPAAQKAG